MRNNVKLGSNYYIWILFSWLTRSTRSVHGTKLIEPAVYELDIKLFPTQPKSINKFGIWQLRDRTSDTQHFLLHLNLQYKTHQRGLTSNSNPIHLRSSSKSATQHIAKIYIQPSNHDAGMFPRFSRFLKRNNPISFKSKILAIRLQNWNPIDF